MKIDKKLLVGAIATGLSAIVVYVGNALQIQVEIITGAVAAIAAIAAWLNGRDNTV